MAAPRRPTPGSRAASRAGSRQGPGPSQDSRPKTSQNPRLGPRSWSVYPTLSPCIPNRLGPTVCDHLMKHTIDLSLSALLRQHTDSRVNYHPESTHPSWRHPRAAKALPCIRNRVPHPQRLSLREVQDYLPCYPSQGPWIEPQAKALEARQPVLHEWVDSWGSSTFPSS